MIFAVIKPDWRFPVVFHLGGGALYAHQITDFLAYSLAISLYFYLKRKWNVSGFSPENSAWLILGCLFGALIGAKVLAWAESPHFYWSLLHDSSFWLGGKTIVGGLLGGWVGLEIAKRFTKIHTSTGDLLVFPLIVGISVGRIGCFLTGLEDHTCGLITRLPWGVDFGDGVPRHPAQLYEIGFLLLQGLILVLARPRIKRSGGLFRWFMLGYLSFRFAIEFIKPREAVALELSPIQWGCLAGLIVCLVSLARRTEPEQPIKV